MYLADNVANVAFWHERRAGHVTSLPFHPIGFLGADDRIARAINRVGLLARLKAKAPLFGGK